MKVNKLELLQGKIAFGMLFTLMFLILRFNQFVPGAQIFSAYYVNIAVLVISVPLQIWLSMDFYQNSWWAIKNKKFRLDFIIALLTTGLLIYSMGAILAPRVIEQIGIQPKAYFEVSIIILTLFLVGRFLQAATLKRIYYIGEVVMTSIIILSLLTVLGLYGRNYPTIKTTRIIKKAQNKIIPAANSKSFADLKFNNSSYQKMVEDSKMTLTDEQSNVFAGFDVLMPCCGYKMTVANFSENCQCGHHLAAYGLIKEMVVAGQSHENIQKEVGRWTAYFFPDKAVADELQAEGNYNFATKKALEEVNSKGSC